MRRSLLVTGGAGYIGSHVARALLDRGDSVLVVDSLVRGHRDAVDRRASFVQADVRDADGLARALAGRRIDACLHFAALALVGESAREPERYHDVNVRGTATLAAALRAAGVQEIVFSSTAAVYGDEAESPIGEDAPRRPCNPYGASKAAAEDVLFGAEGLSVVALRYFNAAGAHEDGTLRERHEPETHLVPLAIDAATGAGPPLVVFGADWPTRDGTCVRDYVHVQDLAAAHLAALDHLAAGGASIALNLGTGVGATVREVLDAVGAVVGRAVPHAVGPRRDGDPAALVASAERARAMLGWAPIRDLPSIVRDAARTRGAAGDPRAPRPVAR